MPRSRGAITGLLLVLLGAWGALIPFVGPHFHFAYTPDHEWTWTAARGWLEVFPGVTTAVGGLLLIGSANRVTAMFGCWLAVFGGAWFVLGGEFASTLRIGDMGHPVASTDSKRALLEVSYFSGLGVLIVLLGGAMLARVAIQHARDLEPADPPPTPVPDMSAAGVSPRSEVSPDAITQARVEQFAAPDVEEPRESFASRFRRRRAGATRR